MDRGPGPSTRVLSGTQVQTTSATSGNVSIRLQGLDGCYTQLLKDGFPLYGGFSGSLSILQVPPLDLLQVEVIKGAGSALYGGDAIAKIINLISRKPDSALRLNAIVNETNRSGTDFGALRLSAESAQALLLWPVPADKHPRTSTTMASRISRRFARADCSNLLLVTYRDYYQLMLAHKADHKQTVVFKNSMVTFIVRSVNPQAVFPERKSHLIQKAVIPLTPVSISSIPELI